MRHLFFLFMGVFSFLIAGNQKPIQLTEKNFKKHLKKEDVVLVDYYSEWCGPCRKLSPIIEELKSQYSDEVCFAVVNGPKNRQLLKQKAITAYPTLILFEKGQEVDRLIGLRTKEELIEFLRSHSCIR